MRVQAGIWRGRRLLAEPGERVRPTADRTREALFNILRHGMSDDRAPPLPEGIQVLDAFAGTGALGIEALSRGAAGVTFLDNSPASLALVRDNLRQFAALDRARLVQRDAAIPGPPPLAHSLVLLDPPYRSGLGEPALTALATAGWLAPGAIAVLEIAAAETILPPAGFLALDERRYGAARLAFLRWSGPPGLPESPGSD